ncbi:flagellar export chaperone FliS [Candidatus Contendibacter odensensis]|uniref:flagellar export chaperone FliS n=1 Tax=Candidatus Contendibacter odensensis TaxID=1400860 RepID=UPI003B968BDE
MRTQNALRQYQSVNVDATAAIASPHRLVQMLFEGGLERLASAKGHLERSEVIPKSEMIGKAVGIINGLREGLNFEAGGELAINLDRVYDYLQRRLLEANLKNDIGMIDEVAARLTELKTAWDEIGPQTSTAPIEGEPGEINSTA